MADRIMETAAAAPPNEHPSESPRQDNEVEGISAADFKSESVPPVERTTSAPGSELPSREGTPPPLPPRPKTIHPKSPEAQAGFSSLRVPGGSSRPSLQAQATTALSVGDIHTQSGAHAPRPSSSRQVSFAGFGFMRKHRGSDAGDSISIRSTGSYAPTLETGGEVESIVGDVLAGADNPAWKLLTPHLDGAGNFAETLFPEDSAFEYAFMTEFDELDAIDPDGSNEELVMNQFKSKLKHFLILSSAGKPIWSRHGDDRQITNYIGVVSTIISFYQGAKDVLKGFTAGDVRFVVMSKGPLNLVAISRFGESDTQLRVQLESLYMQILSTLTLPNMERMFKARASTDLRRPLRGTETLLSALADGFTRGSPSTLLSALECLRIRKTHRTTINNTLLKVKSPNLLYGLIVAGGRLVSVVRPKKHSLHPGDLQLIFNMLFEAGSVKAGGGENWIPLCLPGFNNTGYLYMYVSFLNVNNVNEEVTERPSTSGGSDEEVAILLISPNKEGFFELRQMRDDLVEQLSKNASLNIIRDAVNLGRLSCTDIIPGTVLRHFLYKSRANVQFFMPSFDPYFNTPIARRRLLTLYNHLHTTLHTRPSPTPKIHHVSTPHHMALAWSTPLFELYAVAPSPATTSRAALAAAANALVGWVRKNEERVFIIGGGVF
ncbi:DUF254-domain-containing protein [Aulographum hederae CBS 113979]|uniref:Vacuolar fusion protein MON1 n=1 Tax=Aulographum hederae CBS 113979 TaxID=1176131 RepID=A0A6G1H5Q2_9PEZI|nr:DUF254-domain-containing protein [Aulographum hederae CBS 113979]